MSAFNDVMTPGKFDNMYYQHLYKGAMAACFGSSPGCRSENKTFRGALCKEQKGFLQSVCSSDGEAQHLQDKDRERW
ncbi:unnamed protein product [Linum tenue]|nr:unnamed protein product [Linum tenue]